MRIVKAIENMTASNRKLMYMCNTRPVLKDRGVFSDVTEEYRNTGRTAAGGYGKASLKTGKV